MPNPEHAADSLRALLRASKVDIRLVTALLDELSPEARVHSARSLGAREQKALWQAAEGVYELGLEFLVPSGVAAQTPVRHFGRNSLPAFTHFEKRFFRTAEGQVYGANFQLMAPLTGPGYFGVSARPEQRELLVDYGPAALPSHAPAGWPAIVPNERGISRLVYGFLVDRLRRVSEHVSIGEPARNGKALGSWFVLCREAAP
ncbi:MAG TPA: hypothetical protein VK509_07910 [Polyangiales bacterium]|nr:hypothetical protein [Polyangiales bacterium]